MREILATFLKIGATAYGGPAIMGVMQAEFRERRRWLTKAQFVEGLAFANMLPGATATQLGIFLGYRRAGWWGGLLAGLCFCAPAFAIMLALTLAYSAFGVSPVLRGALYGLGPIVLAVFAVAVYRLGRTALQSSTHVVLAVGTAAVALFTPVATVWILLFAGGVGLFLFHDRRVGALVLATLTLVLAGAHVVPWSPLLAPRATGTTPRLGDVAVQFAVIGSFTFGGSLSIIALIQDQVVHTLAWLTPQEFIDGLALGQLTPGPPVMLAAYVGYKTLGLTGAVVAAIAIFLPSFAMMLALLPVFERVRAITWARAALQGMVAGVIGTLGVALVRLAPHAVVDPFAVVLFVGAVTVLMVWRVAPLRMVAGGAVLGIVRRRLGAVWGV
jgi:chromate transporter